MDFVKRLKFFAGFASDRDLIFKIASNVELATYPKDEFIFEQGMIGLHFFMVLDGEVSIVRCKKDSDGEIREMSTLVKLFRGQTFGETALESKGGFRTAGALATQHTHLLTMHVDIYKTLIMQYKSVLRLEVRSVLSSCPAFTDWEDSYIEQLASSALIRNFGVGIEILKEGDVSKNLYIIKQGMIKLIKSMDKPKTSHIKVSSPSSKVQNLTR